ncbi:DUF1656 domain-containing protein [Vreelandella subglaciescola]|jgi:hypothetical protein|uniref:DUF1656 domain-containing protein n=1 Tax=Vreelandella subglaciescola TaxID=29571 RepID=A0A1M7I005_9GAMM|nr:DUF1656 domain-containing protein [Halomonas subglaciescola]SHM33988.1 Protein of unknown function [Halomonas subglaciescola]
MGLHEIAIGGLFLPPLFAYVVIGLGATFALRALLFRLQGGRRLWFEAWFDTALFVLCTAATAYIFSAPFSTTGAL